MIIAGLLAFTIACQIATAMDNGTYSISEYPLPANATDIGAMTMDTNGNVWLIQNEPPVLYKLMRENGTFEQLHAGRLQKTPASPA